MLKTLSSLIVRFYFVGHKTILIYVRQANRIRKEVGIHKYFIIALASIGKSSCLFTW